MKALPAETDFIVVGAGIAGLRASVELASAGRVLCLAKREVTESNTQYAQGGIAAALSDDDEVSLHLDDTLKAGDGLCNEEAARILVEEGPPRIEELIEWGTQFDRAGHQDRLHSRRSAQPQPRAACSRRLDRPRDRPRSLSESHGAEAHRVPRIRVHHRSAGARWPGGRRARARSTTASLHEIHASAVLLATGGLGQVYSDTTNPPVATGDGVAMAHRAGAEISDMEFVQFHPTALYLKGAPRFLLSEALRGEGAYLRNLELKRFMHKYHEMGELAPRDVVARAIAHELEITKRPDAAVYLDLTHLNADHVRKRFPTIYATCMQYNIDIAEELVPIRPAAHYAMGGVRTDLDGRTSIPGLYAAGEVACTGVHGANRLASNSLLEGLVYGARAARAMRNEMRVTGSHRRPLRPAPQSQGNGNSARDREVHPESAVDDVATRRCRTRRKGS